LKKFWKVVSAPGDGVYGPGKNAARREKAEGGANRAGLYCWNTAAAW